MPRKNRMHRRETSGTGLGQKTSSDLTIAAAQVQGQLKESVMAGAGKGSGPRDWYRTNHAAFREGHDRVYGVHKPRPGKTIIRYDGSKRVEIRDANCYVRCGSARG